MSCCYSIQLWKRGPYPVEISGGQSLGEGQASVLFKNGEQLWQTTSCDVRCIRFWPKRNQPQCGAHAFRRFRTTWLRKNGVPKDLEHFWLGHADEEVGDIYSKLKDDVAFRQEVTRRIGYGFELLVKERVVGPNGPKIKAESVQEVAVTV